MKKIGPFFSWEGKGTWRIVISAHGGSCKQHHTKNTIHKLSLSTISQSTPPRLRAYSLLLIPHFPPIPPHNRSALIITCGADFLRGATRVIVKLERQNRMHRSWIGRHYKESSEVKWKVLAPTVSLRSGGDRRAGPT